MREDLPAEETPAELAGTTTVTPTWKDMGRRISFQEER